MMNENKKFKHIAPEKFRMVQQDAKISDVKFDTKPVGYFKDAFSRFKKNKSSVTAAIIIIFLLLFALFGPMLSKYETTDIDGYYKQALPKASALEFIGWDGTRVEKKQSQMLYDKYNGIGLEKNSSANNVPYNAIKEVVKERLEIQTINGKKNEVTVYDLDIDSYNSVGFIYENLNDLEYVRLQAYQYYSNIQVFFPLPFYSTSTQDANLWYHLTKKEYLPLLTAYGNSQLYLPTIGTALDGEYTPAYQGQSDPHYDGYYSLRIDGDDGTYLPLTPTIQKNAGQTEIVYTQATEGKYYQYSRKNATGHQVRLLYKEYYKFKNTEWDLARGVTFAKIRHSLKRATTEEDYIKIFEMFEFDLETGHYAEFWFGTNQFGKDIFTMLGSGARLSFILAICVSIINLTIGAVYGAIEGYYGGTVDLIMERVSEILSGVPFIVVATLFNLHLADKVGTLGSLLFAFVLTGWLGMAGRVRMQFYRFKGQEYILSSRTLGAKDFRIMFRHIFPNAIGTIITGSILSIPGVIFSESTLSYLNIIDLKTSGLTSVGTLLSDGSGKIQDYPHILLFPVLFISLLMISFNLFGNGLRDAFNPSLRGADE